MCSKCEKIEDLNINCARVTNMSTCSGRNIYENLLSTSCSAEYSRIRFMLFHKIKVNTIESFVQKVCRTELEIVYRTAGLEMKLFNKVS